ncbi:hypothetical protein CLAFUW4_11805 [Fulvia fulva]|nr:hypothetical protein CLAFUR4_11810 [Fulvia fulva]KAK4618359.1 hypothetical protein CLAFUR0_11823 [Fulvia fulva]WPV18700.1 hypothetical protein CLAFUW4_11805 [Fulvia fulva]WPV33536.1 hypothetical protein CLAFUW7_11812 [Fulvia fulva]
MSAPPDIPPRLSGLYLGAASDRTLANSVSRLHPTPISYPQATTSISSTIMSISTVNKGDRPPLSFRDSVLEGTDGHGDNQEADDTSAIFFIDTEGISAQNSSEERPAPITERSDALKAAQDQALKKVIKTWISEHEGEGGPTAPYFSAMLEDGRAFVARSVEMESKPTYLGQYKTYVLNQYASLDTAFSTILRFGARYGNSNWQFRWAVMSGYYKIYKLRCAGCKQVVLVPVPLFEDERVTALAEKKIKACADPRVERRCRDKFCDSMKKGAKVEVTHDCVVTIDGEEWPEKRGTNYTIFQPFKNMIIKYEHGTGSEFLEKVRKSQKQSIATIEADCKDYVAVIEEQIEDMLDLYGDSACGKVIHELKVRARARLSKRAAENSIGQKAIKEELESKYVKRKASAILGQNGSNGEAVPPAKKQMGGDGEAMQSINMRKAAERKGTSSVASVSSPMPQSPPGREKSSPEDMGVEQPAGADGFAANDHTIAEINAKRKKAILQDATRRALVAQSELELEKDETGLTSAASDLHPKDDDEPAEDLVEAIAARVQRGQSSSDSKISGPPMLLKRTHTERRAVAGGGNYQQSFADRLKPSRLVFGRRTAVVRHRPP